MLKHILITLLFPVIFTFCDSKRNNFEELLDAPPTEQLPRQEEMDTQLQSRSLASQGGQVSGSQTPEDLANIGDKIIREGHLRYQVANWQEAKAYAEKQVKKWDGYISNENQSNNPERITVDLTIRVPNEHFDTLLNVLTQNILKLEHKSINARDVTGEYIDIQSRLENKREVEKRYRELLSQATRVEDIVNIEEKLANVREAIESIEARLEYLDDKVAYSTIQVHLYEKLPFQYTPTQQENFGARFVQALHDGWNGFVSGILFLFSVWPYVILIVFGVIGYRRYKKNKRNERI